MEIREKGYEIMGSVNGPNEGLPEYEVSEALLELVSRTQNQLSLQLN